MHTDVKLAPPITTVIEGDVAMLVDANGVRFGGCADDGCGLAVAEARAGLLARLLTSALKIRQAAASPEPPPPPENVRRDTGY